MQTSCPYLAITGYFKALNLDKLIEITWAQHSRLSTGHRPPNFKTDYLILNITVPPVLSFEKKNCPSCLTTSLSFLRFASSPDYTNRISPLQDWISLIMHRKFWNNDEIRWYTSSRRQCPKMNVSKFLSTFFLMLLYILVIVSNSASGNCLYSIKTTTKPQLADGPCGSKFAWTRINFSYHFSWLADYHGLCVRSAELCHIWRDHEIFVKSTLGPPVASFV